MKKNLKRIVVISKPTVELMHYTPLAISDLAIGKCWGKGCFEDEKLIQRMDRVANKFKHASTIEHTSYNFNIKDVSRALLQELARHRISSFSVKSTRYTLKEIKELDRFVSPDSRWDSLGYSESFSNDEFWEYIEQFIVLTGDERVDACSVIALQNMQDMLKEGISNDKVKFCLPESFKTELVWTINARSLQNFLKLRTDKSALWEIRNLAYEIYEQLPQDHKFLFKHTIYKKEANVEK